MKTSLYSLLLALLLVSSLQAQTATDNAPVVEEQDTLIQIEVENAPSQASENPEKELENKIKRKVLSIFSDIIDAAGEDLSDNEKQEVRKEIEQAIEEIGEIEEELNSTHSDQFDDKEPYFLGAMAIFFVFGTPIMIIAAVLYSSYRKKKLMHDTINQYVSSGKDIPDEVLKGLQKESTPKSNLHRGLIMSGFGLGIFSCMAVIGSLEAAALGLIPLFIGLAQLLIWKLENK